MTARGITVSDHALVRWLERMHGIDMEFFRGEIAGECRDALQAGATRLTCAEGSFILDPKKQNVVTILGPDMKRPDRFDKQRLHDRRPLRETELMS